MEKIKMANIDNGEYMTMLDEIADCIEKGLNEAEISCGDILILLGKTSLTNEKCYKVHVQLQNGFKYYIGLCYKWVEVIDRVMCFYVGYNAQH